MRTRHMKYTVIAIALFFSLDSYSQGKHISIEINAVDLSEDLNRLSTQNDEVLLFIYEMVDSSDVLNEPIYYSELKFDTKNRVHQISTGISRTRYLELLLIVLERDTERPIEQIEPVIRVHYSKIEEASRNSDYNLMRKLLGDDDILGTKRVNLMTDEEIKFQFHGIQKMDKYIYNLALN